ncbi:MAG: hypothetical protein KJ607_04760, partial [Bacteroidetes bacterium]|nr:hypothetical protein [Bacteroidota bacterium]
LKYRYIDSRYTMDCAITLEINVFPSIFEGRQAFFTNLWFFTDITPLTGLTQNRLRRSRISVKDQIKRKTLVFRRSGIAGKIMQA